MSDKEKFESFKRNMIEENERRYGAEARERYGSDAVDASNAKLMNMTREQYAAFQDVQEKLHAKLAEAVRTGEPGSAAAQEAAELHRRWLGFTWAEYSREAHLGLVQMYVDDPRFTAYYEQIAPGAAELLRGAVRIYCGQTE